MRPLDAASRLAKLLARDDVPVTASGNEVHGAGDDWRRAWDAFCELAHEPADDEFERGDERLRVCDDSDCDLLLHESGPFGGDDDRFAVYLTRQFYFVSSEGEYAGMNALTLILECDGLPEGRVPRAQRWGYAGRRRDDVSDEAHPEMAAWAGYVDNWKAAAERSNSFKVLETLPPARWRIVQENI
jgi:hypothetical protein